MVLLLEAALAIAPVAVVQLQHHFPPYPTSLQFYTKEVYSVDYHNTISVYYHNTITILLLLHGMILLNCLLLTSFWKRIHHGRESMDVN